MKKSWAAVFLVPMLLGNASAATDSLDKLADDFWTWRAKYAPFTGDDVNRMERPGGIRDWSKASIETRRKDLAGFETRWKKIDATLWPIRRQVDYRLIGSALSRVRWELDINPVGNATRIFTSSKRSPRSRKRSLFPGHTTKHGAAKS